MATTIKPLLTSSRQILELLGGEGHARPPKLRQWQSVLAPARPTANDVRYTIKIPGWLYDKFFTRALLAGVRVEDVILLELQKTELPDPVRGEQDHWLVSTENLYARTDSGHLTPTPRGVPER
jgi:hypothetical protein